MKSIFTRRNFAKQSAKLALAFLVPFKINYVMNPKGVVVKASKYSVKETIDRLQTILQQRGATIYSRINQQAEIEKAGGKLSPLEFIMFGNPKIGGAIMAENKLAALDLPLKVIAWEDEQNKVWIAYNEASYIEERYSLAPNKNPGLNLERLVNEVAGAI